MTNHHKRMLITLTIAGGAVDAIIILGFGVLTAAQTGNTILLSVALARGDLAVGISAMVSVLAFVTGVVMGQALLCALPRRFRITGPLSMEAIFLIGLFGIWDGNSQTDNQGLKWMVIACAAVAMGIQSAVILDLRARSTTYITGMLSGFATGTVREIFERTIDAPRTSSRKSVNPAESPWKSGVAWLVYALAAWLSGVIYIHFGVLALAFPVLALGGAMILNLRNDTRNPEGI